MTRRITGRQLRRQAGTSKVVDLQCTWLLGTGASYQELTTMPGAAAASPAVQEAQKALKTTEF